MLVVSSQDLTHSQGVEFGNLFTQCRLDTHVKRHVRARTAGAHAGQPHGSRIAIDANELDVAAIGVQEGSHARSSTIWTRSFAIMIRSFQSLRDPTGLRAAEP